MGKFETENMSAFAVPPDRKETRLALRHRAQAQPGHKGPVHPYVRAKPQDDGPDFEALDRLMRGWFARTVQGGPVLSGLAALHDWGVHLAFSPGRQLELAYKAFENAGQLTAYALDRSGGGDKPRPFETDRSMRFTGEAWQRFPFDLYAQSWLATSDWWRSATSETRGLNAWSSHQSAFLMESVLAAFNPANFPWLNPEIIDQTLQEGGDNLKRGWERYQRDIMRTLADRAPPVPKEYEIGARLAATPGKVVYRSELIELIQYAPATEEVHSVPLLVVPAWIMKYYILDLSEHNSLVRWLVSQGFTVFMVSWKNPTLEDRAHGLEDYLDLGVMAAIDAITSITDAEQIQACGYCLGGTLLSVAAARMARDGDDCLRSVTLLAAQTDFSEPGELRLLVDEAQVTALEDMMAQTGLMPGRFMGGGFMALRPERQIWDAAVRAYLLGEDEADFDILVWNKDTTRMPGRMMSEYLRWLYLENRLARAQLIMGGSPVSLSDLSAPIFAVGTTRDHVSPWASVYKIHRLANTDVTFVLTTGGHNAGILSEPGHQGRRYRIATKATCDPFRSPERWLREADGHTGSWWLAWRDWLIGQDGERRPARKRCGARSGAYKAVCDAPGTYVHQR